MAASEIAIDRLMHSSHRDGVSFSLIRTDWIIVNTEDAGGNLRANFTDDHPSTISSSQPGSGWPIS